MVVVCFCPLKTDDIQYLHKHIPWAIILKRQCHKMLPVFSFMKQFHLYTVVIYFRYFFIRQATVFDTFVDMVNMATAIKCATPVGTPLFIVVWNSSTVSSTSVKARVAVVLVSLTGAALAPLSEQKYRISQS
jgi:hypothetical protein